MNIEKVCKNLSDSEDIVNDLKQPIICYILENEEVENVQAKNEEGENEEAENEEVENVSNIEEVND